MPSNVVRSRSTQEKTRRASENNLHDGLDLAYIDLETGRKVANSMTNSARGFRDKPEASNCFFRLSMWFRTIRTIMLVKLQGIGPVTKFILFSLPCFIDATWVILYFRERSIDLNRPEGQCFNASAKPTPPSFTLREDTALTVQKLFAFINLFVYLPFRTLFAGSYKYRGALFAYSMLDIGTALPFIIAIFLDQAQTWYVPSFLRVWILRFELGFVISPHNLSGEVKMFFTTVLAWGVMMIAMFEWSQNNFPIESALIEPLKESEPTYACTSFGTTLYWLIVTLSTVGYGDVSPVNSIARYFTLVSILIFLLLLPSAVARLTGFIAKSRDRRTIRFKSRGERHIVVHGHMDSQIISHSLFYFNPVRRTRRLVRDLAAKQVKRKPLNETPYKLLFQVDSNESPNKNNSLDLRNSQVLGRETPDPAGYVVLVSDNELSDQLERETDLGYQRSFLSLFEGSLLNPVDLSRCQVSSSSAVFVLPIMHTYTEQGSLSMSSYDGSSEGLEAQCRDKKLLRSIHSKIKAVHRASNARTKQYTRDYQTLLRAWSAHKSLHDKQLLVVVLFHGANEKYLLENRPPRAQISKHNKKKVNVRHLSERHLLTVSLDRFQQEMLAASCLTPGISTLLTNLFIGEDHEKVASSLAASKDQEPLSQDDKLVIGDTDDLDDVLPIHSKKRHANFSSTRSITECPCESKESAAVQLRHYARGVQHEVEVLVLKRENPFLGWSRIELATTIYRDFQIVLIAVCEAGNDTSMELFSNLEKVLGIGDTLVLVGRGSKLDSLFATQEGIYSDESSHAITQHNFSASKAASEPSSASGLPSKEALEGKAPATKPSDIALDFVEVDCSDRSLKLPKMPTVGDLELLESQSLTGRLRKRSSEPSAPSMLGVHTIDEMDEEEEGEKGLGDKDEDEEGPEKENTKASAKLVEQENRKETTAESPPDGRVNEDTSSPMQPKGLEKDERPRTKSEDKAAAERFIDDAYVENYDALLERCPAKGHIILCSSARSSINYFVDLIRHYNVSRKTRRVIVWLVTDPPSEWVWAELSDVHEVFWLLGESSDPLDLIRAGIEHAHDIVITSDFHERYAPNPDLPTEPVDPGDVDRFTVQTHRTVSSLISKHLIHSLRVHTHLSHPENCTYFGDSEWEHLINRDSGERDFRNLDPKAEENNLWSKLWGSRGNKMKADSVKTLDKVSHAVWPLLLSQPYAAGQLWSTSSFLFILFFGFVGGEARFLWTFLQTLLRSCGKTASKPGEVHGLRLVALPPKFHGQRYEILVKYCMIKHRAMCLGINRGFGHGSVDARNPVVMINPHKSLELMPCDYLYLLGGTA